MLGIGLGGFMDGFTKAQDFKLRQRRQEIADQQAKRQQTIDAREDTEYDRAVKQRDEITAINTGAKAEFDNRVAAGTEKPNNFDTFWSNYALPKLKNTYLAQGNIDMANKAQAWGESEDARAGAKLFMSSLSKYQLGDYDGAVNDAFEGAKRKGYLAHDYEFTGKDTLVAREGGPTIGYRFTYRGGDGKDGYYDVPLPKLGAFIANIGNPEAAWQSQIASQADAVKRQNEISDYRTKAEIDKELGNSGDKRRGEAITALRKRMDGGLTGGDKKFDDLTRADKEKLIEEEMSLQKGPGLNVTGASPTQNSVPERKIAVDRATGRPVPPPQANARSQQQSGEKPAPQSGPKGASDPEVSRRDNVESQLTDAEDALASGVQPQRIAEKLAQNGIPEDEWPMALKDALTNRRGVITGLSP